MMSMSLEYASPPSEEPSPGWGQSLGNGAAGIALWHIEQACAGMVSWQTVHQWIAAAVRSPVTAHPDSCSLYRGAPAIAFILRATDHPVGCPAYANALAKLDEHIAAATRYRLNQAHDRINRGELPTSSEFDLVSGLTGIGAYLLYTRDTDSREPHTRGIRDRGTYDGLLCAVLRYLVWLTEPLTVSGLGTIGGAGGVRVPGWWSSEVPTGQPPHRWPGGHGNLGIAHGIAGPLALLSMALRRGIRVPGHPDAIERICAWLDRWRVYRGPRVWWPGMISLAEQYSGTLSRPGLQPGRQLGSQPGTVLGVQRPSWCYGTPGLARAQQLAGIALSDQRRRRQAEHALLTCVTDDFQLNQLTDASLCHGWAGLLHTTWRAASDATGTATGAAGAAGAAASASGAAGGGRKLAAELPRLQARMALLLQHQGLPAQPGFLEGTAGIRLAQQALRTRTPPPTSWDTCLLLNG